MRQQKKRHRLSRPAEERRALLRTMTIEVLKYGRITTTEAKAKAVKGEVEHMITLAKRSKDDLSARRAVSEYLLEKRTAQPKVLSLKDKTTTIDESKYKIVKQDEKKAKVREKTVAQ